jgi:hypothetical protein
MVVEAAIGNLSSIFLQEGAQENRLAWCWALTKVAFLTSGMVLEKTISIRSRRLLLAKILVSSPVANLTIGLSKLTFMDFQAAGLKVLPPVRRKRQIATPGRRNPFTKKDHCQSELLAMVASRAIVVESGTGIVVQEAIIS